MNYRGNGFKVIYVAKKEELSKVSSYDTNVANNRQQSNGDRKGRLYQEEEKTDYRDNNSQRQNFISKDGAGRKQDNLDPIDPNPSKRNGTQDAKYEEESKIEESKIEETQLESNDGMNSREHNSENGVITDPFKKALAEVMKIIPKNFKSQTNRLYKKLKTNSNKDEQVLFMLLHDLFGDLNRYDIQCMIATCCHLLLDDQYNIAHSCLNGLKLGLTPKLAQQVKYLPVFMDFLRLFPQKAQLLDFPKDNFFPEKEYLRITDFKYTPEDIFWVSFKEETHCAKAFHFLKNRILAIDGEWKPYGNPNLALLQIATSDCVFLFDMLSMRRAKPKTIDNFASLFRDPYTTKVFFACSEDIKQICNIVNRFSKKGVTPLYPEDVKSIVDLQIALSGVYDLPDRSLKSIAKFLFKKDLCKLNQCSNWNKRPLREAQIHYAALDAIVTLKIYKHVVQEGHNVKIYSDWKEIEPLLNISNDKGVSKKIKHGKKAQTSRLRYEIKK